MDITLKPLEQQVIVITGASSGIGLATAALAAARGARLVLVSRSEQTLDGIVEQMRADGHEVIAVVADVGQREAIDRVVAETLKRFGQIDTWINNAGVAIYGRIEEVSDEDSRRLFDTNFWGVVNGSRAALPELKRHGGALINLGSEVSDAVIPLQGMYSASKHAVKGFTDALRVELEAAQAPVSVTLIQPTAVNTPYPHHARNYMPQEAKLPTPQIDPHQVAEAILDAAVTPRRSVKVGAVSKLNTTMAKIAPRLGDWVAKKQMSRQQEPRAPRNPQGSLHQAGSSGRIHG